MDCDELRNDIWSRFILTSYKLRESNATQFTEETGESVKVCRKKANASSVAASWLIPLCLHKINQIFSVAATREVKLSAKVFLKMLYPVTLHWKTSRQRHKAAFKSLNTISISFKTTKKKSIPIRAFLVYPLSALKKKTLPLWTRHLCWTNSPILKLISVFKYANVIAFQKGVS